MHPSNDNQPLFDTFFLGKCYMNTFYSYTPLYTPCIWDILISSSHNHTFSSICVGSRLRCVKILCGCKRYIVTWGGTCITTLFFNWFIPFKRCFKRFDFFKYLESNCRIINCMCSAILISQHYVLSPCTFFFLILQFTKTQATNFHKKKLGFIFIV